MINRETASRQLGLHPLRRFLQVLLAPVFLEACCVTTKSRVPAHENLTQVLEQVENGYPQIPNHKKIVTKTFTEYNPLTRELASVYKEHRDNCIYMFFQGAKFLESDFKLIEPFAQCFPLWHIF